MGLALESIRVLDLTRLLPGPFCTVFLADFGADVIKIEEPEKGDYGRMSATPFLHGISARHWVVNRNKRSMTLNLKESAGRDIFLKLVSNADIVVESFRPGVMAKLGLDYQTLAACNPRIICCSISGYGQSGPYRDLAGHDLNYCSLAGLAGETGKKNGPPVILGTPVADFGGGGLMATVGILLALVAREHTGEGQYIDISMMDGVLFLMGMTIAAYFANEENPIRGGGRLTGGLARYQIYTTKDGEYISVGALEEKFWVNLCRAIQREDLVKEITDDSPEKQEELISILSSIFLSRTRDEWLEILSRYDACCTPVNTIGEVLNNPQVLAREMIIDSNHPVYGVMKQLGFPIKLSKTPGAIRQHAPALGEHTDSILKGLEYSEQEMNEFREKGII